MQYLRTFALCVAALAGCGGETDEAKADKMATIIEEIAAAATIGGEDCAKIASEIEKVFAKRESEMKKLKPWIAEVKNDDKRGVKMAERMAERLKVVRPQLVAITKCGDDPAMKASTERLKMLMKP